MLAAIDRVAAYTTGLAFESFCADLKTVDAVIRNFEVMGEAARHVDEPTAALSPSVPWPNVRDMRNILDSVGRSTRWGARASDPKRRCSRSYRYSSQ
jgi:uncharacterized protein with HEPN domain